jgi:hypothetical protein
VTISAHGKFSVASNLEEIDEKGYIDGRKRGFNRAPDFKNANHGCYVARPVAVKRVARCRSVGSKAAA